MKMTKAKKHEVKIFKASIEPIEIMRPLDNRTVQGRADKNNADLSQIILFHKNYHFQTQKT